MLSAVVCVYVCLSVCLCVCVFFLSSFNRLRSTLPCILATASLPSVRVALITEERKCVGERLYVQNTGKASAPCER